jgi:hypothetical protein
MSTGAKTTAGTKGKTKDTITQIKRETEGQKDSTHVENEDNEWNKMDSDEEETQTSKKGVIVEQGKVGTDKPKNLKDLFASAPKQQTKAFKPTR